MRAQTSASPPSPCSASASAAEQQLCTPECVSVPSQIRAGGADEECNYRPLPSACGSVKPTPPRLASLAQVPAVPLGDVAAVRARAFTAGGGGSCARARVRISEAQPNVQRSEGSCCMRLRVPDRHRRTPAMRARVAAGTRKSQRRRATSRATAGLVPTRYSDLAPVVRARSCPRRARVACCPRRARVACCPRRARVSPRDFFGA